MRQRTFSQQGSSKSWMIGTIGCLILFLIAGALAIWAYMAYSQEKSNVDSKISLNVAEARRDQSEIDQKKFSEEAKNPRIEFVGPSEYGRVSFMYPKTWSVYVDKDGSNREDYRAYLHPVVVPPISNQGSRYAFRVEVLNKNFDKTLDQYKSLLKKGDLVSSSIEVNGSPATRLDGAFSKELRGVSVLLRIRDKTVVFSSDADTFKPDFKTILDTVKFVQ